MISTTSTKLQKDLSWIQGLNPEQKFCWAIVAACCQKTSTSITTDSFDWVHSCNYIVSQLCQIYASYCKGKKLPESEKILLDPLPQDIVRLHSDDVYKFFEWVRKLQTVLLDWQKKFVENDAIMMTSCFMQPVRPICFNWYAQSQLSLVPKLFKK